jgi:transcriptional regulator with PAS, ATPase and Fis domain
MSDNYSYAFAEMGLSESAVRILEHSYDGIMVTLKDSTIIYINNAYSRVLGIAPEHLLGRKLSQIEPDSIILKVLKRGHDVIHVSEHVDTLNESIFGSVLLLPSQENFVGSISIITKMHQKTIHKNGLGLYGNIEFYMDQVFSRDKPIHPSFSKIIGQDAGFRQTLYTAHKAAQADFAVVVMGESGTGKELIVRAIHEASNRAEHEFVALNCAALPSNLVESELFGYERGSFTDAKREGKKGLFDLAHKGTLFFDEIGDFELSTQAKILRVLEEKTLRRIGGEKDIHIDTRLISATNKDLEAMILNGKFREDLFYRINTMTIQVPPLRERGQDLTLLSEYFLSRYCLQYKKKVAFSDNSLSILYNHDWPGNVRELKGAINYAVNITDTASITPRDLPPYLTLSKARNSLSRNLPSRVQEGASRPGDGRSLFRDIIDSFEKDLIDTALKKSRNRTEAMKLLGLSRRAFYLKLNKHGLI